MYGVDTFTLNFPELMDAQDWQNFADSLAPQVMCFLYPHPPLAYFEQLRALTGSVRKRQTREGVVREHVRLVLFIDTAFMIDACEHGAANLLDQLRRVEATVYPGTLVGVVLGNEWDRYGDPNRSLQWGSPNWGNGEEPGLPLGKKTVIDLARYCTREIADRIRATGSTTKLITGAYSMRGFTEDDLADPGLHTWRELLAPVWYGSSIQGNAVHFYDYGWWVRDPERPQAVAENLDVVAEFMHGARIANYCEDLVAARLATKTNVDRFKHAVRFWSGYHHKQIYLRESNTNSGTMSEAEHMESCIGKSKVLLQHNSNGRQIGERVAMYSPFASNGLGNAYPSQYIMRSHDSYIMLAQHMVEEGYLP